MSSIHVQTPRGQTALEADTNLSWVRQGVILAGAAYGLVALFLIFMGYAYRDVVEQVLVALVCLVSLRWVRAWPRRVGVVVMVVIWCEVMYILFSTAALEPSSLLVLPVLVVVGGLLLDKNWSIAWAVLTGVAIPVAQYAGRQLAPALPPTPANPVVATIVVEITLVASLVFARTLIGHYRQRHVETERQRQRFTQLFDQVPDCLVELDEQQVLREINAAGEQLLGAPRAELIGRSFPALLQARGFVVPETIGATTPGQPLALTAAAGPAGVRHLELAGRAGAAGPGSTLLVVRDVTSQRLLAERQADIQRLETVGRLAAGIAHDFNNVFTAIQGHASLLRDHADPEVRDFSGHIITAQQRGARLTRQMLSFARHDYRQPEVILLAQEMLDWSEIFRRMLGTDCTLELKGEGGCLIEADKVQIEQILLNLLANARDASPAGGTVVLEVVRLRQAEATRLGSQLEAARQVMFVVADRGSGMGPEVKRHLFEPFFTTKPPGKGTGMGLAATYGLVTQNRGSITIESEPGQGTTVRVFFSESPAPPRDGSRHPASTRSRDQNPG
ncbi:two-component system sensor histidine kinase NtrB [Lacunisphaera limnophila]|nr:ATP-binding protein [Lacunisphaera limnophila]